MAFENLYGYVFACVVFASACKQPTASLNKMVVLSNYPSGSALAFVKNELYLMGDDASSLLKLDKDFNITDSVLIFENAGRRMDKASKPDLEAMTVVGYKKIPQILMLGSGSADSARNVAWLYGPDGKEKIDLTRFYNRLKAEGLRNLNIEGLAKYPGGFILTSRGNKSFRKNFLVFASKDFLTNQDSADIRIASVGFNTDTSVFNGISGAEYASNSDKLLLTVSTENTYDSYNDGSIGKSYLWIINDISTKKFTHVNPDRIIDLEALDAKFKGHKIESVCIVNETRKELELVLAADDDRGDTRLFAVIIKK